jgi:pimeloyl-ACP methyl ester carboxylesterase
MQNAAAAFPRIASYFGGVLEFTEHIYAMCAHFGVGAPDPIENEPVVSDIPTLMLAGEYDPITPPFWAWQTAETLSTSYVYEFSGTGHAVIARGPCPGGLIRQFLANPYSTPNGSCVR